MSQYPDEKHSTNPSFVVTGASSSSVPPQGPPPAYYDMTKSEEYTHNPDLIALSKRRGISPFFATQLDVLTDPDKVQMLFDDSGSMRLKMRVAPTDVFSSVRENVMAEMVEEVFDFLAEIRGQHDPITCRSMNRYPNGIPVSSFSEFQEMPNMFKHLKNARTPTVPRLTEMLTEEINRSECGWKTFVFTDGVPDGPTEYSTEDEGFEYFRQFLSDYQTRHAPKSLVTIGLVTGDEDLIAKYGKVVDGIPGVDVMSVHPREMREIQALQGPDFTFTKADWLVKFLIGPSIPAWDKLDEEKLSEQQMKLIKEYTNEYFGESLVRSLSNRSSGLFSSKSDASSEGKSSDGKKKKRSFLGVKLGRH
jgi:hypothetical protein